MFHRSERLLLRPIFFEDWPAIYNGISDHGVVSMLANAPWPYTEADAREFVLRPSNRREPRFAVVLPGSMGAPVIGCIGIDVTEKEYELGYWLARPYWGKGYMTEAALSVAEIARMMGLPRLVAGHATDNPASGRVLAKAGFHPTGELRSQMSKGRGCKIQVRRMVLNLSVSGCIDPEPQLQAA